MEHTLSNTDIVNAIRNAAISRCTIMDTPDIMECYYEMIKQPCNNSLEVFERAQKYVDANF